MIIRLDGTRMNSRSAAHDHLQLQLSLPAYYGRNLDALYDLLTENGSERTIALTCREQMLANLGSYGGLLLETLRQAADENPHLNFTEE